MPITVTCPSCDSKLNAPLNLAGRTVKCPKCGHAMKIPAQPDKGLVGPSDQAEELPQASPPPVRANRPNIAPLAEDELEVPPDAPAESPTIPREESHAPLPMARVSYALGIPSLVLGVLGLLFGWMPALGLLSLLLGGLGLLLGIAGLVVAIILKGRGISFAIVGLTLSLATLVLCLAGPGLRQQQAIAKSVVELGQQAASEPNNAAPLTDKTASPLVKEAEWVDATKGPAQLGHVRVKLGWVVLGNVKIKNEILGEEKVSDKKYLCIQVFVQNMSEDRKLDYRGWSGVEAASPNLADLLGGAKDLKSLTETLAGAANYAATLTDEANNVYKRIQLDTGSFVVGQVVSEKSIYPKQSAEDLLVFESPVDKAQFLRLELPAATYRGTGALRLQIPKSVIRR